MTINKFNTGHNDYKALPEGRKNMVQSRLQFLDGKKVTLRFKPFLEVFHLSKPLVPGVQLQMEMYFNDPALWTIRWTGTDTLRLTEADVDVRYFLCQVKVNPSIYREIMTEMKRTQGKPGKSAAYPIVHAEIRTYSHPTDNRHFECNNPFQGQIANRLVVVMCEQAAFNGHVGKSPFCFKRFNMSSIKQLINGEEYPYERLELQHDGATKDLRGYQRFLRASGCLCRGKGNMIRKEDWGYDTRGNLFATNL